MSHVTLDPEQRLYAACAAVFAGGSRCMQPLLPLQEQTPLCAEHAWKRVSTVHCKILYFIHFIMISNVTILGIVNFFASECKWVN